MHLKNDDNEDESASRLDVAAKAAGIGVWEFDPISGRLDWDDRCRELFGISSARRIDYQTFLEGLHSDDREAADLAVQRALDPTGPGGYEIAYRTVGIEDGKIRHIAATGRTFFEDREGQRVAVRFVGAVVDISAILAAQDELKETESQYRGVLEATNDRWIASKAS